MSHPQRLSSRSHRGFGASFRSCGLFTGALPDFSRVSYCSLGRIAGRALWVVIPMLPGCANPAEAGTSRAKRNVARLMSQKLFSWRKICPRAGAVFRPAGRGPQAATALARPALWPPLRYRMSFASRAESSVRSVSTETKTPPSLSLCS